MATYMPIGVFGDLLNIARLGHQTPAAIRGAIDARLVRLDADFQGAGLPAATTTRLQSRLIANLKRALFVFPRMPLAEKIALSHALAMLHPPN
jgi:hypothetical protein